MGFFSWLFGKKSDDIVFSDQEIINAGACPNCWGKQEYDGQYKAYVKDQTKANINNDSEGQKAFVQQFIETNVTGIRLKKDGDLQACPVCKTRFKHVSAKAN